MLKSIAVLAAMKMKSVALVHEDKARAAKARRIATWEAKYRSVREFDSMVRASVKGVLESHQDLHVTTLPLRVVELKLHDNKCGTRYSVFIKVPKKYISVEAAIKVGILVAPLKELQLKCVDEELTFTSNAIDEELVPDHIRSMVEEEEEEEEDDTVVYASLESEMVRRNLDLELEKELQVIRMVRLEKGCFIDEDNQYI